MARLQLDQLSAEELNSAIQKFRKTEKNVERDATDFPGPGWDTVRELMGEAGERLDQELKRRYGMPAT